VVLLSPLKATIGGIPLGQFLLRVLWVSVRLLLVIYLGKYGIRFFYQGF
jgi:hypothetical protein